MHQHPVRFLSTWLTGTVSMLVLATCVNAQPPAGYYDSAQGLTGQPLRMALHNIIDNHDALSYNALWNAFATTDAKPGNKVWDIYSDIPNGTPPYVYTLFSDQCGSYGAEGDCYNREHSFPQSWFNSANPMRTDLFHIYPTDGWVNNKRGNLPYGEVGSADWTSQNGSKVGLSVSPGYGQTVFEPIDAYKGDLARTYFYMVTRYAGEMSGWSSPMLAGGDLSPWAAAQLVEWNGQDPVSAKETARNNAVFALQDNRNPYIDHPEWVDAIWGTPQGLSAHEAPSFMLRPDASGLLIERGEAPAGTLHVLDMEGRTVLAMALPDGTSHVPFGGTEGFYIAQITTAEGRSVQRFAWLPSH
ncbi:MAG TPA: endonuclease [Flavobacteriales bacterium]|nr:endonuclease [Flavobacteriales bacterium]